MNVHIINYFFNLLPQNMKQKFMRATPFSSGLEVTSQKYKAKEQTAKR
jgi:hypothetical protein